MSEDAFDSAQANEDGFRLRRWAAIASLSVALLLIVVKIATYLTTESAGVLSSLMDSLVDGLSSAVTLISVRAAQRPPSRSYRFGRGKAEPLAALAQAAFILGSAILLGVEVFNRILNPQTVRYQVTGIEALLGCSVIVIGLVAFQRHVVRRTSSVAIRADLTHYFGDIAINVAVIAGLYLTIATGRAWFDTFLALGIASFLVFNSVGVGRQAVRMLMDRELGPEARQAIRDCVMAHPGARGLHDLRTRDSGTMRFIELHLELDGALSLAQAHDITDEIEQSLQQSFPASEILIHQEPAGLNDRRLDQVIAETSQSERKSAGGAG